MRPTKPAATVKRAKRLRRELSKPEAMLWQHLRGSPDGIRFRNQHPAGPFILDFFCARANLAIDIDGYAHDTADRPARDARRDQWLADHRIDTLRIPAADVLRDATAIAHSLVAVARERMLMFGKAPLSSLRDAASPSSADLEAGYLTQPVPLPLAGGVRGGHEASCSHADWPTPGPSRTREGRNP